ncbi:hypothetical protein UZ36_03720 [Candidatus Nitromaritima sp. SCGC AAA799-C22]|nr:hypothetical protein UZ36_03720 [Candidatus Nitromaritima sp. SCGC AAA799-C22]
MVFRFPNEREPLRDKLLKLLEQKGDLPPLPDVLLKLENHINDPNSDLDSVAALIETDPVLQGRLIKLANSVLYGGGRDQADSLSTALLRLGLKMVLDLAYTSELPKLFNKVKSFNQMQFWKHSLAVGYLSRELGRKVLPDRQDQEICYLCGLMHDVGILVFEYLIPDKYSNFVKETDQSQPLGELEKNWFGIGHPELGARFVRKWWTVPDVVVEAVEKHHESVPKLGDSLGINQIVYLANVVAIEGGVPNEVVDFEEPLDEELMESLGFDHAEREAIMETAREGLALAESMLMG